MTVHATTPSLRTALALLGLGALCAPLPACVEPSDPSTAGLTQQVEDWRDEVIYQILTDRFSNGDRSNDYRVDVDDPSAYHGGDWQGILDRLDYLDELGVTALWISPVVRNVEEDAGFASYHGYWAQDFTRTNPHFGDVAALRRLVDGAHARGMKVILDIVTNHVGQAFYYDINRNGRPDEWTMGQGERIGPIGQTAPPSSLTRITEWDPDYYAAGIQSWTSLGPSGDAPIVFLNDPEINRVPPEPAIFAQPWAYNRRGRVTVWSQPEVCGCSGWGCAWDDPCRREQEMRGDFPGGLKDLDTTRPDVRDALFDVYARWIEVADFDGFRIDTLKHVEVDFWDDFCPRIRAFAAERGKENFFLFGEAFDGDDNLLGEYTQGQGVDGLFYFSQYYSMFRGALLGDGSRTCELERLHCRRLGCPADPCGEGGPIAALYSDQPREGGATDAQGQGLSPQQLVVNFSSNHDVGRLLFFLPEEMPQTEKRRILHQGLAYLVTAEGVPSLYYGVEQEFAGGNDPANRETLWDPRAYRQRVWKDGRWQLAERSYDADGDGADDTLWRPFDRGNPTFRWIQRLLALRREHVALRRGAFVPRWSTRGSGGEDHGLFAFERVAAEERALVLFNLGADQEAHAQSAGGILPVGFAPGSELHDLLDPARQWTVAAEGCAAPEGGGCLDVSIPARGVRILAL